MEPMSTHPLHAGQKFPPLAFKHEYFARNVAHGPSLQYLAVDPGPQYAISTNDHTQHAGTAPDLLTVTRSVAATAEYYGGDDAHDGHAPRHQHQQHNDDVTGAGSTMRLGMTGGAGSSAAQQLASATLNPTSGNMQATLPQGATMLLPAGSFRGNYRGGTTHANFALTTQSLQGSADARHDMGASLAQQFSGGRGSTAGGAPLDVTRVGPTNAIVTAKSAIHNAALLGQTAPGMNNTDGGSGTMVEEGSSGGVVYTDGAGGLGGRVSSTISTVIHPLDAFPATKRLVADEKAAQIDAERFRKRIVSDAIRRDTLMLTRYPHGALGVDSVDNEQSLVYAEVAARRRLERERAITAAAQREARILGMQCTEARRGYNFLRPETGAEMARSARVDAGSLASVLGDARAATRDGVKVRKTIMIDAAAAALSAAMPTRVVFPQLTYPHRHRLIRCSLQFLQHKTRAADPLLARGVPSTARVITGDTLPATRQERTKHLVNNDTNGRAFNIVTGKMHPEPLQPSIGERKGFWRHAHPSIASFANPLDR